MVELAFGLFSVFALCRVKSNVFLVTLLFRGMNETGCCGNHICDGAETGMNCPSDCPRDIAVSKPDAFDSEALQSAFIP